MDLSDMTLAYSRIIASGTIYAFGTQLALANERHRQPASTFRTEHESRGTEHTSAHETLSHLVRVTALVFRALVRTTR